MVDRDRSSTLSTAVRECLYVYCVHEPTDGRAHLNMSVAVTSMSHDETRQRQDPGDGSD